MRVAVALITATTLAVGGCAAAINYSDPAGPVFSVAAPPPGSPIRSELRIVTFNLRFGVNVDGAVQLFTSHGSLYDADIVVLQEMDLPGVERIGAALAMGHVYVPSAAHPSSKRDFGVAVLSRWPMLDGRKVVLPHAHRFRRLRRAAVAATIDTPIGAVRVYGVHLETALGATDRSRSDQARAVLADATSWSGPIIIAGDFNGAGGDRTVEKAGFTWLTRRVRGTAGPLSIDHIFVRGLCARAGDSSGRGPKTNGVSDHRPVWGVVQRCAVG
jgi:endonuclease/exonuclease/phosphatase family metal-dependent hydrolase